MEVTMTIGLAPVTKKNSQQILKNAGTGRPFIVPSRAYREYAEAAAWCLRTYRLETIRQPVEVKALFYMPTRRRVDLTNLLEALDAFRETFRAFAQLCVEDAGGDQEIAYTKESIDRELRRIMGEGFRPWEERYPPEVFK